MLVDIDRSFFVFVTGIGRCNIRFSSQISQHSVIVLSGMTSCFVPRPSPVDILKWAPLLKGYPDVSYIVGGFKHGFDLLVEERLHSMTPASAVSKMDNNLCSLIQKEMDRGRILGPYNTPPLDDFWCSPAVAVPIKDPGSFRMIHNLSSPGGWSVNDGILKAN